MSLSLLHDVLDFVHATWSIKIQYSRVCLIKYLFSPPFPLEQKKNWDQPPPKKNSTQAFNAGDEIEVEWLYVGNNELFDIYVRQGEGDLSLRVSENLCAGEPGGSCAASNIGSVLVTLPAELEDGADYSLLVVDKKDDDAYGMSRSLSVGVDLASATRREGHSTQTRIAIVIAACAGG